MSNNPNVNQNRFIVSDTDNVETHAHFHGSKLPGVFNY